MLFSKLKQLNEPEPEKKIKINPESLPIIPTFNNDDDLDTPFIFTVNIL